MLIIKTRLAKMAKPSLAKTMMVCVCVFGICVRQLVTEALSIVSFGQRCGPHEGVGYTDI